MRASLKELKKQMEFVVELTKRLDVDIKSADTNYYNYKPSRIRNDIMRIRRELNTLSKMTEWEWKNEN